MDEFISQIYKKTNASKGKTVFVDRDGTLNKETNYLSRSDQIEFLTGTIEGIKRLNKKNVTVIVITNQPVVARGLVTIKAAKKINDKLFELLAKEKAYINAVYSCPHHPEKNHADIPPFAMKYRIECSCRKPGLGMFKKAVKDFNINLETAYLVGDRTEDIESGKNLGIPTILVRTGYAGKDNKYTEKADYEVRDFSKATDIILNHE